MYCKQKSNLYSKKARYVWICIIIFCCYFPSLHAEEDTEYIPIVNTIIKAFKTKDRKIIAGFVTFPFQRHYPISPIYSPTEFIQRFDEVFDDFFINTIIYSSPQTDWKPVGWRGIMFDNGLLWLHHDGKISAVNYQTAYEKKQQEKIIWGAPIHWSDNELEYTVLEFKTEHHRIRIDYLGKNMYRYASWSLYRALHHKPEFIIEKGRKVFEDGNGNHRYIFRQDNYKYECSVFIFGENGISDPEILLDISKDDKILFTERSTVIIHH